MNFAVGIAVFEVIKSMRAARDKEKDEKAAADNAQKQQDQALKDEARLSQGNLSPAPPPSQSSQSAATAANGIPIPAPDNVGNNVIAAPLEEPQIIGAAPVSESNPIGSNDPGDAKNRGGA